MLYCCCPAHLVLIDFYVVYSERPYTKLLYVTPEVFGSPGLRWALKVKELRNCVFADIIRMRGNIHGSTYRLKHCKAIYDFALFSPYIRMQDGCLRADAVYKWQDCNDSRWRGELAIFCYSTMH